MWWWPRWSTRRSTRGWRRTTRSWSWMLWWRGGVDKEVTKMVEEVNKKLVKEVNDGLVLV